MEAATPALLELLGCDRGNALVESISGVAIRSLEAKSSPTGVPLHFGRRDKTLAIGLDRKFVAACLAADSSARRCARRRR